MKQFLLSVFFCLGLNGFAQQQEKTLEVNQYLKKSLRQKKTGNILAISGGALFVSGLIITETDDNKALISSQQLAGIGISALGVLSALTSIPFYISANRNKSKSLKLFPSAGQFSTPKDHYVSAGFTLKF